MSSGGETEVAKAVTQYVARHHTTQAMRALVSFCVAKREDGLAVHAC